MWVQVDVIEVYLSLYFARKRTVRGAKIPTPVRSRASMRIEGEMGVKGNVSWDWQESVYSQAFGVRCLTCLSEILHV